MALYIRLHPEKVGKMTSSASAVYDNRKSKISFGNQRAVVLQRYKIHCDSDDMKGNLSENLG